MTTTQSPATTSWSPGTGTSFQPPRATPAEPQKPKPSRADRRAALSKGEKIVQTVLAAVVVMLVVAAGFLVWTAFTPEDVESPLPDTEFEVPAGAPVVGETGKKPVDVGEGKKMTIEDMAPDTVFIPSLGIYMPVESDSTFVSSQYAGFDTLRIPADPKHGVHYASGAPMAGGEEGTTLVASHVSSRTGWGALRYLYELKGGELIHTKDAEGRLQTWQMTRMRIERHTSFPQEYWAADGDRQLVLTTCGGPREGGHFVKNVFAIAVPIDLEQDDDAEKEKEAADADHSSTEG